MTVTVQPASLKRWAADSPASPPPTTTTLFGEGLMRGSGRAGAKADGRGGVAAGRRAGPGHGGGRA